jgi:hypothetical protein
LEVKLPIVSILFLFGMGASLWSQTSSLELLEKDRQFWLEHDKLKSPDQWDVQYLKAEGNSFSPAFVDIGKKTAYRWKDVVLRADEIPKIAGGKYGIGSFNILPIDAEKLDLRVLETAPPIRYFEQENGKFGGGFFDHTSQTLYQWKGVEFTAESLPSNAVEKGLIVNAKAYELALVKPPKEYLTPQGTTEPTIVNPASSQKSLLNSQASTAKSSAVPATQSPQQPSSQSSPPWPWAVGLLLLAVFGGVWWKFLRK